MSKKLQKYLFWERRLRYPLALGVFALYMFFVFLFFRNEEVYLPQEKTPVVIYSNQVGDDLRRVIKEAILQAKESISIMIYSMSDPEILDALKRKADEGVRVLLIQDASATHDIGWRVGNRVGIHKRRAKGLMHDKIVVIDHKLVLAGSANFTRDSFLLQANLVVGMQSTQLAQAIEVKIQAIFDKRAYKSKAITIEGKEQTIQFFFLPDSPQALDKLTSVIKTAKKTIKVAIYTFTNKVLSQALIDAKKRGVDVEVVIDRDSSKQTSIKAYQQLKREGVRVYASKRKGLLHHKLAIIDDEILITGSANWTKAAFFANDDNIFFIYPLTFEQKEKMLAVWKVISTETTKSAISVGK